jgi:hypothetical protein
LGSTWEPSDILILSIAEEGTLPPRPGSKDAVPSADGVAPLNLDEHSRRGPRETTPSKTNLPNTKRSRTKLEIDHI